MTAKADPEVVAFMRRVMTTIGVETPSDLAGLLVKEDLLEYREARQVFRWFKGESAPSHKATLMLLRRAGLIREPKQ